MTNSVKSVGMEKRDFACILLPTVDHELQLLAIKSLLDLHKQAEQRRRNRITAIEHELQHLSGMHSDLANIDRVDLLNMSVYEDAAHSMAAIGMLAPFIETIFYQTFRSARSHFGDTIDHLPEHPRWKHDVEVRWDCRFFWKKGEKFVNLVEGIMQLSSATGLKTFLPPDLRGMLTAVFAYRNKMFHLGLEWPIDEREKFCLQIVKEKWPKNWFVWSTRSSSPWICYMTDTLVTHCIVQIDKVLEGIGQFAAAKLPGKGAR